MGETEGGGRRRPQETEHYHYLTEEELDKLTGFRWGYFLALIAVPMAGWGITLGLILLLR